MIIVITGPTCMGKSETALEVAKALNAVVINGDAFQVYEQMNIGVAKPPKEYFSIVPHKLYSFVDIKHEYSIAEYQKNIRKEINEALENNQNVVIVGGSGLYIRSALFDYEFSTQDSIDMSKYNSLTNEELHNELYKLDPEEAIKIHQNNRKRVLRAIEICLSQGKSKTEIIAEQQHKLVYDAKFFVRDIDREVLYEKINKRVDLMMQEGLLEEVKNIVSTYGTNLRALQAIGYKELIQVIKGEITLNEGIELVKKSTRNYAKRQMTFIRHQFPVTFYKDTNSLLEMVKSE